MMHTLVFVLSLSCIPALGYEGDYKYKEDNLSELSGHCSAFVIQRLTGYKEEEPTS